MVKDKTLYLTTIISSITILIAIFTPFAVPYGDSTISKESQSFVWIWGLYYLDAESFCLLRFLLINLYFTAIIAIFAIIILISAINLKNKKISLGKFGEQLFICNVIQIISMANLTVFIEYSYLFLPNLQKIMDIETAEFWYYRLPGFGYYGIFIPLMLLLYISVLVMYRKNSNFFSFAVILAVTLFLLLFYFFFRPIFLF
ncbi:MAG: hypothetical protein ACFE9T_01090 [Promethearchaeota archaeon]